MPKTLFGTDGIRGTVNRYPMNAEVALKFGMASGIYLQQKDSSSIALSQPHRWRAIIAKDTRLSGYLIEPALTSGLTAVGVDVTLVGPMPTPAVPMLIKSLRADFGIMITASHNPYYDNGLKLFDRYGFKLSDYCEQKIQELILGNEGIESNHSFEQLLSTPDKLGRASRLDDAPGRYIEYVKGSFPKNYNLSGLRIVLDCANGSAYKIAPTILWELGAEVIEINSEPNGLNINENCGSSHPAGLSNKVSDTRADIGIAFDGDGDRILVCDEYGNVIPGDYVIALIASYLKDINSLNSNGIVATYLSNGALEKYLNRLDIKLHVTKVGDRYVAEEMRKHNCNFGGEQSGHIILGDYNTTGDGIMAALQILAAMKYRQQKASELFKLFTLNPQINSNIPFTQHNPLEQENVLEDIEKIRLENKDVKILVRKSGTEKVVRIMVEGEESKEIKHIAENIENIITNAVIN